MWSPGRGCWTTQETGCCQPLPQQVLSVPRVSGWSREPGSACWANLSSTARRAAGETCATGGSKTTCTTCWRDREPGRSSTTRSCKFAWTCGRIQSSTPVDCLTLVETSAQNSCTTGRCMISQLLNFLAYVGPSRRNLWCPTYKWFQVPFFGLKIKM